MDELKYWQTASNRRLARRTLLRASAIAAAGAGMAVLAGCGRKGANAGKANAGGAATSTNSGGGQPQRGGVLTGRLQTDPPSLDIHQVSTWLAVWPEAPAYNQLLQYDPQDPDNTILPDLADSYEMAGDGRSIVFKLHPGVTFHDGAGFTSEDVKANIDWIKNPPPKTASPQQAVVNVVDHVETPDPLTAKLVLKRPNPSLLGTLASDLLAIGARGDLAKGDLGTQLNGTGPFRLKSVTRGVGVELERNPTYWVKDRPYLDGVKFSVIADDNTAMTDLVAGRLHRHFAVLPENMPRVERETSGKAKAYSMRQPDRDVLFFNSTRKPFNDPRVRQAVSLVIDRNEAIQAVVLGLGAAGGYMLPGGRWAIPSDQLKKVPGYDKADIGEAKKLLAAAGVTESLSGTLLTRNGPAFVATATYVQGTLQKALGWNLKIDARDSAAAFAAAYAGQFDLCNWVHGLAFDDPDAAYGLLATSKASANWSKVFDAEADDLYEKQSQTIDAAQRKQLAQQLELKYLNDFQLLTLFFRNANHAIWNVVQNYKLAASLGTNQRYQDVWLNKS